MRRAAVLVAALALPGCSSTQDKARALADGGQEAFTEQGVKVGRANPDVEVVDTAVLTDANGSAAVVVLRSRARRGQAALPVAIDVQGAGGKSVFRNDAPGLEPSLTTLTAAAPGATVAWVNDQVVAAERPRKVAARVGLPRRKAPRRLPELKVQRVRLGSAASTGVEARGRVVNASKVDQRDLVLFGVARKGRRIVAAGRAQVRRVRAGGRAAFRMFFIGDPRGADLTVSVPPTSF